MANDNKGPSSEAVAGIVGIIVFGLLKGISSLLSSSGKTVLPPEVSGQLENIKNTFTALMAASEGQLDFKKDMVVIRELETKKDYEKIDSWLKSEIDQVGANIILIETLGRHLDQLEMDATKIEDSKRRGKVTSFASTLKKFPPAMEKVFIIKKEVLSTMESNFIRVKNAGNDNLTPEETTILQDLIRQFDEAAKVAEQELKRFNEAMANLK